MPQNRNSPESGTLTLYQSNLLVDLSEAPQIPQITEGRRRLLVKDSTDEAQPGPSTSHVAFREIAEHEEREDSPDHATEINADSCDDAVNRGRRIIDKLLKTMSKGEAVNEELRPSYKLLKELKTKEVHQKSIIGVVGGTGVGKSSLINALLEEEILLPTNCMRACTAVVTEISYNHDPEYQYIAEIEFIGFSEWTKELRILFNDLQHAQGTTRGKNSEAAIALAKMKAVYPGITKEKLLTATPESLLREQSVKKLLGTTVTIKETNGARFYPKLHRYLDNKKERGKEMEYWPLIKVVRIYCKSPALSTGAIIVDLPGSHDANVARVAVAEEYMKNCNALWIVAPITRAVDDKTAHHLLGEMFRRQLLMDGGFASVVFVCTKSDDVSISEVISSLGLESELAAKTESSGRMEVKISQLTERVELLKQSKSNYTKRQDELDDQLAEWEEMAEVAAAGEDVYEPTQQSPKADDDLATQLSLLDIDSDFEVVEEPESGDEVAWSQATSGGEPLTESQIGDKIAEIRAQRKQNRKAIADIEKDRAEAERRLSRVKSELATRQREIAAHCIRARNRYSAAEIRQDFAAGLRELDEEEAERRDPSTFDPSVELRDYAAYASRLPVFCVSSRSYQKMQGRLRREGSEAMFTDIAHTGLPDLQKHCMKITQSRKLFEARRFLETLSRVINSLSLWALQTTTAPDFALDQNIFVELQESLDEIVDQTFEDLNTRLRVNLYETYLQATERASQLAPQTSMGWRSIHWSTYRAVCSRHGSFHSSGSAGLVNFNGDLVEPLNRTIAAPWEQSFVNHVPATLANHVKACAEEIEIFHAKVKHLTKRSAGHFPQLRILRRQLVNYRGDFRGVANNVERNISTLQKDINRLAESLVRDAMVPAYDDCAMEGGPGCYARMKATIEEHVQVNATTMFQSCAADVEEKFEEMMNFAEDELQNATERIFGQIKEDYKFLVQEGSSKIKYQDEKAAMKVTIDEVLRELRGSKY
ncbi:hypothetical protein DFH27DRAFT_582577 [Peziza echinospora]|nr:hypothetical protein DFH27DRAFT_582577 [Peziza echinospora]